MTQGTEPKPGIWTQYKEPVLAVGVGCTVALLGGGIIEAAPDFARMIPESLADGVGRSCVGAFVTLLGSSFALIGTLTCVGGLICGGKPHKAERLQP